VTNDCIVAEFYKEKQRAPIPYGSFNRSRGKTVMLSTIPHKICIT